MGQKVNPHGLRVGVIKDWDTQWYADKKAFSVNLKEDYELRKFVKNTYFQAAISSIKIERAANKVAVTVFTARPGVLIGKAGAEIEVMKNSLAKIAKGKQIAINIVEVKKPDSDSQLVAESIAAQLEKRVSFKRALKSALQRVMKAGAKGCKVQVSGVVDGANTIARTEYYMEGNLPLSTLRADIDYATGSAFTNYGKLGVKVWIYKGEILGSKKEVKGGQD